VEKCIQDEFGNNIKVSDGRGLKYQLGYLIVRLKIDPSVPRILSSRSTSRCIYGRNLKTRRPFEVYYFAKIVDFC
jgi:hypothetical protein